MPKLRDKGGWKELPSDWTFDDDESEEGEELEKEHITWETDHVGGLTITFPSGKTAYLQGDDAHNLEQELRDAEDAFEPNQNAESVEDVWDMILDAYEDVASEEEKDDDIASEEDSPATYERGDKIDALESKANSFGEYLQEAKKKDGKWMQKAFKKATKGDLHKKLKVPEDKKIPKEKLDKAYAKAKKKGDTKTMRQINAAKTAKKISKKK